MAVPLDSELSPKSILKSSRRTVVVNLTPRLNNQEDGCVQTKPRNFKHFKYNNRSNKWVVSRRTEQSNDVVPPELDLFKQKGYVSVEDEDGTVTQYYCYTVDHSTIHTEGYVIDLDEHTSFISGNNPFYPTGGRVSSMLNEVVSSESSVIEVTSFLQNFQKLRMVSSSQLPDLMESLLGGLHELTSGEFNISIGLLSKSYQ